MSGTPNLNLLPLFVVVAETGSMSAAARRLGMPKSSVSRGVASLEESLGVQLLHRTTRKVALTTAGAAFFEKARPLLTSLEAATGAIAERDDRPSGVLRLTASVDVGVNLLPALAAAFTKRYPEVLLDVRLSNQRFDLVAEGFDAAIRASGGPLKDSTLVARPIGSFEGQLFASPDYLATRPEPKSAEDTAKHDWVVHSGIKIPRPLIAPKRPRLLVDDILFLREAIRAGMGLGILPEFLGRADVTAGRLVRVLPRVRLGSGRLYFVYPPADPFPRKLTAFRDFLFEFLKQHPC